MPNQNRRGNPNWRKGGPSPNPAGRKGVPPDIQIALLALVPAAVKKIKQIVSSKGTGVVQLRAAESILERLYGKPTQQLQHTGADGGTLRIEVVYVSKVNGHE